MYWTLNLRPLLVYAEVLFPWNFRLLGACSPPLGCKQDKEPWLHANLPLLTRNGCNGSAHRQVETGQRVPHGRGSSRGPAHSRPGCSRGPTWTAKRHAEYQPPYVHSTQYHAKVLPDRSLKGA